MRHMVLTMFETVFLSSGRDEYIAPIPEEERQDMVLAYHAQLNSVDEETRLRAAKAWSKWEYVLMWGLNAVQRLNSFISEWRHRASKWIQTISRRQVLLPR